MYSVAKETKSSSIDVSAAQDKKIIITPNIENANKFRIVFLPFDRRRPDACRRQLSDLVFTRVSHDFAERLQVNRSLHVRSMTQIARRVTLIRRSLFVRKRRRDGHDHGFRL